MNPITNFYIMCYHDISGEIRDIEKKIPIPALASKPSTYVFDENQTVRWNREQVELYNQKNAELRREAVELRAQSYKNLEKAVVDYMMEYEALATTPRTVVEKVVARTKQDHDDDWWNYLSEYLDFAEEILEVLKEN